MAANTDIPAGGEGYCVDLRQTFINSPRRHYAAPIQLFTTLRLGAGEIRPFPFANSARRHFGSHLGIFLCTNLSRIRLNSHGH